LHPLKACSGGHPLGVLLSACSTGCDWAVYGRLFLKQTVAEPFLASLLPDVLDRMEFRAARGPPLPPPLCGYDQFPRLVPPGSLEHHEKEVLGVAPRDFGQK
jgi:hypothetical protein